MKPYPAILLFLFACKSLIKDLAKAAFRTYPQKPDRMLYLSSDLKNLPAGVRLFNLKDLSGGTDSFELRIWPWQAFNPAKRVLVFKVDSG